MTVITLLTDYGVRDSYVAEVKGAILKIAPEVTIVDISHDVGNYDIEEGAFHMARSVPYFPQDTVHVGVVDPGVGGKRKPIIIQAQGASFVGPDNGLLAPAAERLGVKGIYEITNTEMLPPKVSDVFDGRDVFGPTGAYLAVGVDPSELGEAISDYIRIPHYQPKVTGSSLEARVIHVDGFGNLVTNVTNKILSDLSVKSGSIFTITVHSREYRIPYARHFSAVPDGELLTLVAGGGYLELSVNRGNAQEHLDLKNGDRVNLTLIR